MPKTSKKLPPSKARKNGSSAVPIKIQRITEERLLDSKLLRESQEASWRKYLGLFLLIGVFVGVVSVSQWYFSRSSEEAMSEASPSIIVPEIHEDENLFSEEATTTIPEAVAEDRPIVEMVKVEILATPTGFLNVRSGPGTNFVKLGQVSPGEIYDLLSEDAARGWFEIQLSSTTTGWVTKQYGRIQE